MIIINKVIDTLKYIVLIDIKEYMQSMESLIIYFKILIMLLMNKYM